MEKEFLLHKDILLNYLDFLGEGDEDGAGYAASYMESFRGWGYGDRDQFTLSGEDSPSPSNSVEECDWIAELKLTDGYSDPPHYKCKNTYEYEVKMHLC